MKNSYKNIVYLVRHGENPANITGEFSYKKVDYSLTPKGQLQAQQTGDFFKQQQIDEVYASPLKRARETAEYIAEATHRSVHIIENFREINIGALEDKPPTQEYWDWHNRIVQDWLEGKYDESFPDGENYYSLLKRMRSGLLEVTQGKEGKHIVIVGHGGIFTRTIKDICPTVDMAEIMKVEHHNCAISTLEITIEDDRVTGKMLQWASIAHLNGEAAQQVPGTRLMQPQEVKET